MIHSSVIGPKIADTMKCHLFCGLLMVTLISKVYYVEGSAKLLIRLVEYRNEAGHDAKNHCCDLFCASPCDHDITFCLDHYTLDINRNNDVTTCAINRFGTGRLASGNVNRFIHKSVIGSVPNPISYPVDSWPSSGIMLKVLVKDHDRLDSDDAVDKLYKQINPIRAKSIAEAQWQTIGIQGSRGQHPTNLEIQVMLYCDESYYGLGCDVFCEPQDRLSTGHYTCDSNTGAKVCLSGYESPEDSCRVVANDCAPTTCRNDGICVDKYRDYECICTPGYTGRRCAEEIDHCSSNPCQNSASCLNQNGQYVCVCPTGYVGASCEFHICDTAQACLNGGTCVGNGECYCSAGFTGNRCETNICDLLTCQNGGRCATGVCLCPSGYVGTTCQALVDPCVRDSIQCINGGTCINGTCVCAPGYLGKNCEGLVDNCRDRPCLNDGTCYTNIQIGYLCDCHPGFTGTNCESVIVRTTPTTTVTTTTTTAATTTASTTTASTAAPIAGGTPAPAPATTTTTTTSTTTTTTTTPTTPTTGSTTSSTTTKPIQSNNDETNDVNNLRYPVVGAVSDQEKTALSWWIYLVGGIGGLLVIAVIVIVVLVSKVKRKKRQLRRANSQDSTRSLRDPADETVVNPVYHIDNVYENTDNFGPSYVNNIPAPVPVPTSVPRKSIDLNIAPRDEQYGYDAPPRHAQPTDAHGNGSTSGGKRKPSLTSDGAQRKPSLTSDGGQRKPSLTKAPAGGLKTPKHLEERYLAMQRAANPMKK